MGKSVNDYYAERMKKLIESSNYEKNKTQQIAPPEKRKMPEKSRVPKPEIPAKKDYNPTRYPKGTDSVANSFKKKESFKNGAARVEQNPKRKENIAEEIKKTSEAAKKRRNINAYYKIKNVNDTYAEKTPRAPEQTRRDREYEEENKTKAQTIAKESKKTRVKKEFLITFSMIMVACVLLVITVYYFLFTVNEISVFGNSVYTKEEIVSASGIPEGVQLYSFRNSTVKKLICSRCPLVEKVDVHKIAPSKIEITVEEEKPVFYADFYGEYRQLSKDMRVLYGTSESEAKNDGLILVKLPPIKDAIAGKKPVLRTIKNEDYIEETISELKKSELWDRVKQIDFRNKYRIVVNCDNLYKITLGDSESLKMKLKCAAEVLKDDMFKSGDKVRIDVSDLSSTSTIIDNRMTFD